MKLDPNCSNMVRIAQAHGGVTITTISNNGNFTSIDNPQRPIELLGAG
ncbi:MAG: hypothetical protein ACKE5M_07230 [Methylophilaceae bacterium]